MSFNLNEGSFVSFAVYSDVDARDSRFFEANEGLTESDVNALLAQASQRILTQIKNTDWWKTYQFSRNSALGNDPRQLPSVDPLLIIGSEQSFKDLNVYFCLAEYLLPAWADFGNETSAEVQKIKFYRDNYDKLFKELIEDGSWYDYDEDGTVEVSERAPSRIRLVRIR